ncbi:MAG: hypothetical protein KGL39_30365 [Patescibacteria group bacterium]|nr:hypothetical protein [Patescibacteria group bacterium]
MIEAHTGKLALGMFALVVLLLASESIPWLLCPAAFLVGVLFWPTCRWFAELWRS